MLVHSAKPHSYVFRTQLLSSNARTVGAGLEAADIRE